MPTDFSSHQGIIEKYGTELLPLAHGLFAAWRESMGETVLWRELSFDQQEAWCRVAVYTRGLNKNKPLNFTLASDHGITVDEAATLERAIDTLRFAQKRGWLLGGTPDLSKLHAKRARLVLFVPEPVAQSGHDTMTAMRNRLNAAAYAGKVCKTIKLVEVDD